jgi:hypothetical protein
MMQRYKFCMHTGEMYAVDESTGELHLVATSPPIEQTSHDPAHDKKVTDVLDHIIGGKSTSSERKAIKGTIDKAEAPLTGRANSDQAMGRALRFGGNGDVG